MHCITPKVLIVDDLEENLVLLEALLAEIDVEMGLELVQSPLDVLDRIEHEEYAVVLTDVHMSSMNGFEFAKRLRSSKRNHATPFIFLTAFYLDEETKQQGYNCGCIDFLKKPYDPVVLRNKLKIFIDLYNNKKQKEIQCEQLNNTLKEKELLDNKVKELARNYRTILEGQRELILKVDSSFKIEFANKAFINFFCFTLDILFQSTVDDISPTLSKQLKEIVQNITFNSKVEVVEYAINDCHNDRKIIEWTVIQQSNRNDIYYLIVGKDVTQRRQLQEALVAKEDKWQKIEQEAGLCSLEWDSYSRILKASDTFFSIFEVPRPNNLLEEIRAIIEKKDFDDFCDIFFNFPKNDEEITYNRCIKVRYDGDKTKYIKLTFHCKYDKKIDVSNVLVLITDITSETNFEVALKESLGLPREVYKKKLFFELNDQQQIIYLTDYAKAFFNFDNYGLTLSDILDRIADDDKYLFKKRIQSGENNIFLETIRFIPQGKEIKPVIIALSRVRIDGKYVMRCLCHELLKSESIRDTLSDKNTAHRISKSNLEQLKASVEKDVYISEYQRKLLEQKSELEVLGEMASAVVHEINQPLSAMSMALDNILMKLEQSYNREYVLQKINLIFSDISRIKNYLTQIPVYNSENKQRKIDVEIDINEVVNQVYRLICKQYRDAKVDIYKNLYETPLLVNGDKYKFQKILVGLFSNSFDALEDNIEDTKAAKKIEVTTEKENTFVKITVTDNGKGINADDLNYIFEPFYSTKKTGANSGLGLYVIKDVITQMGGTITVDSKENEFTTVIIRVPLIKN